MLTSVAQSCTMPTIKFSVTPPWADYKAEEDQRGEEEVREAGWRTEHGGSGTAQGSAGLSEGADTREGLEETPMERSEDAVSGRQSFILGFSG